MGRPARVCVVAPLYHSSFGGVGRQAVALTERLAARGVKLFVITRRIRGLPECLLDESVPVYRVPTLFSKTRNLEDLTIRNLLISWSFTVGCALVLFWKRRRYDIVHFHGASLPLIKNILLLKLLRKKVVAKVVVAKSGVEAGSLAGRYLGLGRVMTWMLRLVDRYAAISAEIEEDLVDEGYPAERVVRIPNFVDTDEFRPADDAAAADVRKRHGLEGKRVVTFSGRLVERKGVGTLIDAWKTVAAEHGDAHLLVLGGGPMEDELKARCKSLGLTDRVTFAGFVSDMPSYLSASDVFVFPSFREGFPNAVLEAMACGLPVVASSIGGVTDVVADGVNGILVEPGSAEALVRALASLITDSDRARALGEKALETIRGHYQIDTVAGRYVDIYEELTGPVTVLMFEPDVYYAGPGGSSPSIHLYELASGLRRSGRVIVVARNPRNGKNPGTDIHLIPGIDRPFLATITYAITGFLRTYLLLLGSRPDVIYARHHVVGTGILLGKLRGVPVVSEVNGLLINEAEACGSYGSFLRRIARWVERIVLKGAARIVAVSAGVKRGLMDAYGIPDEKIVVIENGADTELFRPDAAGARRVPDGRLRVGFAGSFNAWHGVEELIRSVPPVIEACDRAEFVFLGDGPLRRRAAELAAELGVEDRVVFEERVPYRETPRHVASFDVCVILKDRNIPGSPLKLWEYMAAGKPVVATDAEDFSVLAECGAGMLVDPGDPEAVARAITELLNDEKKRREMGENGRHHVTAHRSWTCVARQVDAALREAAETA